MKDLGVLKQANKKIYELLEQNERLKEENIYLEKQYKILENILEILPKEALYRRLENENGVYRIKVSKNENVVITTKSNGVREFKGVDAILVLSL